MTELESPFPHPILDVPSISNQNKSTEISASNASPKPDDLNVQPKKLRPPKIVPLKNAHLKNSTERLKNIDLKSHEGDKKSSGVHHHSHHRIKTGRSKSFGDLSTKNPSESIHDSSRDQHLSISQTIQDASQNDNRRESFKSSNSLIPQPKRRRSNSNLVKKTGVAVDVLISESPKDSNDDINWIIEPFLDDLDSSDSNPETICQALNPSKSSIFQENVNIFIEKEISLLKPIEYFEEIEE